MLDRTLLYRIIYALAADQGRDAALFGAGFPQSVEAFEHSLAGDAFPELWFELPLAGDPWFDLHALTARSTLTPDTVFTSQNTGGYPELFTWFAHRESGVRQLALSYDISRGNVDAPAAQLLVNTRDLSPTCEFLTEAGRPDAVEAYRQFVERLPQGWFACYTGVFPGRPGFNLRVECIPTQKLQCAYAADPTLLEQHLRQAGLTQLGDTLIERCQMLAQTPYQLEFQFDIESDGTTGSTLGVSLRFAAPPGTSAWPAFEAEGAGGDLMRQVQAWGLADDRWELLPAACFGKRVGKGDASALLFNFLAFLKLRWTDGNPRDAKVYCMAGVIPGTPQP